MSIWVLTAFQCFCSSVGFLPRQKKSGCKQRHLNVLAWERPKTQSVSLCITISVIYSCIFSFFFNWWPHEPVKIILGSILYIKSCKIEIEGEGLLVAWLYSHPIPLNKIGERTPSILFEGIDGAVLHRLKLKTIVLPQQIFNCRNCSSVLMAKMWAIPQLPQHKYSMTRVYNITNDNKPKLVSSVKLELRRTD